MQLHSQLTVFGGSANVNVDFRQELLLLDLLLINNNVCARNRALQILIKILRYAFSSDLGEISPLSDFRLMFWKGYSITVCYSKESGWYDGTTKHHDGSFLRLLASRGPRW